MAEQLMKNLSGGCQCGRKRYQIRGCLVEPTAVCHCRMCQKAMGNIFGIFASFKMCDLMWTGEKPDRFQSSSIGYRLFCSNCGTPLAFLPIDEQTIEITIGTLDQPDELAPTEQTGIERQISWTKSIYDLPARTTQEQNNEAKNLINYQHPDHD